MSISNTPKKQLFCFSLVEIFAGSKLDEKAAQKCW
jgi:hypothetical protein